LKLYNNFFNKFLGVGGWDNHKRFWISSFRYRNLRSISTLRKWTINQILKKMILLFIV
jgi:hypothetical protein